MPKPRIIIADTEEIIISALQLKFAKEFFEQIDLEVITDKEYFRKMFSIPQMAGILILSEEFYDQSIQRHNIPHIFIMKEQYQEGQTANLNVHYISKYTSIMDIFNEITIKSADVLNMKQEAQETQVVLFYSASGGTGKTTVSMGICASLAQQYKKVLYLNASRLQAFQHMLKNPSPIMAADIYVKFSSATDHIYSEVKHVVRKEIFSYLPPFKASLLSSGLEYSIYEKMVLSAKESEDYDYIVVDADVCFDEAKASLINIADKVVIVTTQDLPAVMATNLLVANITGSRTDKYIFICNNFSKEEYSALLSSDIELGFTVSEYIERFPNCTYRNLEDFAREGCIKRAAFLIM